MPITDDIELLKPIVEGGGKGLSKEVFEQTKEHLQVLEALSPDQVQRLEQGEMLTGRSLRLLCETSGLSQEKCECRLEAILSHYHDPRAVAAREKRAEMEREAIKVREAEGFNFEEFLNEVVEAVQKHEDTLVQDGTFVNIDLVGFTDSEKERIHTFLTEHLTEDQCALILLFD